MIDKAKAVLKMRDSGRSWSEISQRLGVSVKEAKSLVALDKAARRKALSERPLNEAQRGFLDVCTSCKHIRKTHSPMCETCGPERDLWRIRDGEDEYYVESRKRPERPTGRSLLNWRASFEHTGCDEFWEKPEGSPPKYEWYPKDVNRQARTLGITDGFNWWERPRLRSDVQPSIKRRLKRLKRKLKKSNV